MIEWGVRIDGKDLTRLDGKLKRLQGYLQKEAGGALKEIGELYYMIIIGHIGEIHSSGGFAFADTYWPALSPKWLKEKRKHGWTEEIWEATGGVKGSVKVFGIQAKNNQVCLFVGLKDVQADILRRALENEFGTKGMMARGMGVTMYEVPERPLFEPAKREILRDPYRNEIREAFKKGVKAALANF